MFTLSCTTEDTPLQLILWYRVYHFNDDIIQSIVCVFNLSTISMDGFFAMDNTSPEPPMKYLYVAQWMVKELRISSSEY